MGPFGQKASRSGLPDHKNPIGLQIHRLRQGDLAMGLTVDLGRRIELVPMDPHFRDISIALYRRDKVALDWRWLVHSYSRRDGNARAPGVHRRSHDGSGRHWNAVSGERWPASAFSFEAAIFRWRPEEFSWRPASVPSGDWRSGPRPLTIFDKKSQSQVRVASLGERSLRSDVGD